MLSFRYSDDCSVGTACGQKAKNAEGGKNEKTNYHSCIHRSCLWIVKHV